MKLPVLPLSPFAVGILLLFGMSTVGLSQSRLHDDLRKRIDNPRLNGTPPRGKLGPIPKPLISQSRTHAIDTAMAQRLQARRASVPTTQATTDGSSPTWVRHYINPTEPSNSLFQSVVVDKEGNIYAGGYSEDSFPRNGVGLLVKYNNKGENKWAVREEGFRYYSYAFTDLGTDTNGNVYARSDQKIVKYSSDGEKQWSIDSIWVSAMAVDQAGNVYVPTQMATAAGGYDLVTSKYNTNGVCEWSTHFSIDSAAYHAANDICVTPSGNVVLTGRVDGPAGITGITLEYRNDGTEAWRASMGRMYGGYVAPADSGIIYISAWDVQTERDYIFKFDSAGARQWVRETSGYSRGIVIDSGGNIITATYNSTGASVWNIVKYDPGGSTKWSRMFTRSGEWVCHDLATDSEGNVFLAGSSWSALSFISLDSNGATRNEITIPNCGMNIHASGTSTIAVAGAGGQSENIYIVGGTDGGYYRYHQGLLLNVSQAGTQQWLTTYEGPKVPMDAAIGLGLDSTGSIYVSGTRPGGQESSTGFFILKYHPTGDLLWKAIVDTLNGNNSVYPEMKVSAGGSVFVLHAPPNDTSSSLSLSALNTLGQIQWSNVILSPGSIWWRSQDALLTDDHGDIYFTGYTWSPTDSGAYATAVIAKYAGNGSELWSALTAGRIPVFAVVDATGVLTVLTISSSWVNTNVESPSVARYDESGHLLWVSQIDKPDEFPSNGVFGLAVGDSGSVYVTGSVYLAPTNRSYFRTLKLDNVGVRRWTKAYDEGESFSDQPSAIVSDRDGNVFVGGQTTIVSYDQAGNQRWVQKSGVDLWSISEMLLDTNGGLVVGQGDSRFVKYSGNGEVLWSGAYTNPQWPMGGHFRGFGGGVNTMALDGRGHLYVTGSFGDFVRGDMGGGSLSSIITTLRYDFPSTSVHEPATLRASEFVLFQNYPNPFNPRTVVRSQTPEVSNVKIVIYDLLGREVAVLVDERRAAGSYQDIFDASTLASGLYFCRMQAGKFAETKKLLLIR